MKKLAVLFLAIIISLCAVSSAVAANWVEVGRNNTVIISADKSSLQYNRRTIRVWEKWIYRNESDIKALSKGFKNRVVYSLQYKEYDVNNRTYRYLGITFYDKNGNALGSNGEIYTTETIPPDSLVDYLFNFYKALLKIQ